MGIDRSETEKLQRVSFVNYLLLCVYFECITVYRSCSDEQRGAWASFYKEKGLTYYNTSNKCMHKLKRS